MFPSAKRERERGRAGVEELDREHAVDDAHLVSRDSRGLFQRAILQSAAFTLTQLPLSAAEAFGQNAAAAVGCSNQTAACLRSRPVSDLLANFPPAAIPGVVDGRVLTESVGTALAGGGSPACRSSTA